MPNCFALADTFVPFLGRTIRLNFDAPAAFSIASERFCALRRCVGANAGTGMLRRMSFTYGRSGCGAGLKSPSSTRDDEWLVRVVRRMITGTENFSESSNALTVMSYASCESDGSRRSARANFARLRLSCSFWDECIPGSSAETSTNPPSGPTNVNVIKGSIATLSPTCFIAVSARAPAIDAPTAVSTATFSFTAHSHLIVSLNFATFSRISVEGVPG